MAIKPEFNEVCLQAQPFCCSDVVKCEAKTNVNNQNVYKIIDITNKTYITSSEVVSNKVRYSGRTIFGIVYQDTEGKIKKIECGAEFTGSLGEVENVCDYTLNAKCLKVYTDVYNGMLVAKSETEIVACVYKKQNANLLYGGEGLIVRKKDCISPMRFSAKKTTISIEEEFNLNYAVEEILLHKEDCCTISATTGVGTLIVDGEIYLSLFLLQKIENSDILKERKTIPFRVESECAEAMPSGVCGAEVSCKATKINVVVEEETGKSVVSVTFEVEVKGYVYQLKGACPAVDCYAIDSEVILEQKELPFYMPNTQKTIERSFNGRAVFDTPIDAGARLMTAIDNDIEVNNAKIEGLFNLDCVLNATCYIKNLEDKTETKKLTMPISFNFEEENGLIACVLVTVSDFYVKIVSLNEAEISGNVKITYCTATNNSIKCIVGIEEGAKKPISTSAISVYIPEKNEDLWSVSKRLGTSPERLTTLNPDLEFPLTGDERIVIFRQTQRDYK